MRALSSQHRLPGVRLPRLLLLVLVAIALNLAGCGGTPSKSTHHKRSQTAGKFSPNATWYRVKKGDTLYAVSWRAGVDWRTLARWNRLKSPYTIYPGQLLRLKPPPKSASSTSKHTTSSGTTRSSPSSRSAPAKQAKSRSRASSTKSRSASSGSKQVARHGKLHWQWPVKGRVVSRFSHKDPDLDGIKIAGKRGQKVVAAESGTVVYTGSGLIGYGQLIIVKHDNEFLSAYGLNSRLYVKEGQKVKRGQHISDMGTNSAGQPMLHFEIRRYGKPVDPMVYLPRS